jgi:hypothetical protein
MEHLIASFAQQFRGYKLLQTNRRRMDFIFQMQNEAVRFGMILQVGGV